MRAVGLYRYLPIDHPESLLDVEVPAPEARGRDLLVRVKAVSVNPVDTKIRAPKEAVETQPRILLGADERESSRLRRCFTTGGPFSPLASPGPRELEMKTSRRSLWGAGLTLLLLSPSLGSCADQKAGGRTEMNVIATAAGPVEIGATPVRVPLASTAKGSLGNALAPGQHLYIVLRGLQVMEQPGVLYHLYLGLPPGAQPDESRHAGILNFYGAVPGAPANPSLVPSFDVTSLVRTLRARGEWSDRPTVTFYPAGTPTVGAKASISRVELVVE